MLDKIGSIQEEFEISKENEKKLSYISLETEHLDDELTQTRLLTSRS